ncbi:MAG TPA: hypothetical protein VIF60_22640 [Burkholderiaceae bacterium]
MDLIARHNKITRYVALFVEIISKVVVAAALVVVARNFIGVDVRLNADAPMVHVRLVVFENAPHLSLQRFLDYFGSFFRQPQSHQICHEKTMAPTRQVG